MRLDELLSFKLDQLYCFEKRLFFLLFLEEGRATWRRVCWSWEFGRDFGTEVVHSSPASSMSTEKSGMDCVDGVLLGIRRGGRKRWKRVEEGGRRGSSAIDDAVAHVEIKNETEQIFL